MAEEFKPGDKLAWKSHGGEAVGHVVKKLTSETHIKGHTAKDSKDDPEYLVESEKSGGQAAHKPEALRRL